MIQRADIPTAKAFLSILTTTAFMPKGPLERWIGKAISNRACLTNVALSSAVEALFDSFLTSLADEEVISESKKPLVSVPVTILTAYLTAPSLLYAASFGAATYAIRHLCQRLLNVEEVETRLGLLPIDDLE